MLLGCTFGHCWDVLLPMDLRMHVSCTYLGELLVLYNLSPGLMLHYFFEDNLLIHSFPYSFNDWETRIEVFHLLGHFPNRTGLVLNQEPRDFLWVSHVVARAQGPWSISCCFPRPMSRKLHWKWSNQDLEPSSPIWDSSTTDVCLRPATAHHQPSELQLPSHCANLFYTLLPGHSASRHY